MVSGAKVDKTLKEYAAKHRLIFDESLCKGCDLCAFTCPKKILKLDETRVNAKGYNPMVCFNIEDCIACGMCARICPDSVIKVERDIY